MRKRLISVCIIGILICGIYKYVQIAEAPITKPVVAPEYTEEEVPIFAPAGTEDEIPSSPESENVEIEDTKPVSAEATETETDSDEPPPSPWSSPEH